MRQSKAERMLRTVTTWIAVCILVALLFLFVLGPLGRMMEVEGAYTWGSAPKAKLPPSVEWVMAQDTTRTVEERLDRLESEVREIREWTGWAHGWMRYWGAKW